MSKQGIVSGNGVRLRDTPLDGQIVGTFNKGTALEIEDTWHKVSIGDKAGWMSAKYVQETAAAAAPAPLGAAMAEGSPSPSSRDVAVAHIVPWHSSNTRLLPNDSNVPIQVDKDFVPAMERIDRYAEECDLDIMVTNSFRRPNDNLSGTVVAPSMRSNHLVGHAIDMNVKTDDGDLWLSVDMVKSNWSHLPQRVVDFLNKVRNDGQLRWGGDFVRQDTVHIDDDLWRRDSTVWISKYQALA